MIWYSHINEDSTPERTLLAETGVGFLVVVAGSGERTMALLDVPTVSDVTIVDCNPDALELMRLKLEALRLFSVDEYLGLMGQRDMPASERLSMMQKIPNTLDLPDKEVAAGLFSVGALEHWLRRLRPLNRFWLGRTFRTWVDAGMPAPTPRRFPKWRFRLLTMMYSWSITYTSTANKDPAFVGKGAEHVRVGDAFWNDAQAGTLGSNPMAHFVFAGNLKNMAPTDLPWSFRPEVLQRIKDRLPTLTISYVEADLSAPDTAALLPWRTTDAPVFSSLSDIPSFLELDQCKQVIAEATRSPGSVAVLRSFLRHRLANDDGGMDVSDQERTGLYEVRAYVHQAG